MFFIRLRKLAGISSSGISLTQFSTHFFWDSNYKAKTFLFNSPNLFSHSFISLSLCCIHGGFIWFMKVFFSSDIYYKYSNMTKLKDLYNKCPYTYYLYSTLFFIFYS